MIIQTKAGIPSEKSLNSIFLIGSSIIKPTIISTGAVAAAGIDKKNQTQIIFLAYYFDFLIYCPFPNRITSTL